MPDYTSQTSTTEIRQETHCLFFLLKRAYDVPVQDLQHSQISKLEFQEIWGMQKLPECSTSGTLWLNIHLLLGGGEGSIQFEAVLTQKTSRNHKSFSLKQQLYFSWKFHIQHLPLMNNSYILMLIRSQDKSCSLCVFRMYSFTPGKRSLT